LQLLLSVFTGWEKNSASGKPESETKKRRHPYIVDGGGFVDRFGGELPELDRC
jgi:hypothetical protein